MNRDQALQQLAEDVGALTSTMRTAADVIVGPGSGADGTHRKQPEQHTHRATHLGLLFQLIQALPPGAAAPQARRTQPGSRPPAAAVPETALWDIADGWYTGLPHTNNREYTPGIGELRTYLRRATGSVNAARRLPLIPALLDIRAAAHVLSDEHVTYAAHTVRAYMQHARAALAYDAPTATLRDVVCRYCGGPLKVRSDASSDVWCANPSCVDEGGQPTRWPRHTWYLLLADERAA